MRLSVDEDDPGYSHLAFEHVAHLNGEEVKDCVTADEELGLVIILLRDANGQLELTEDGQAVKRMTLHGSVKIKKVL